MKFVPAYTVSYKGEFYPAGSTVNIDAKDREEMSRHGVVEELPASSGPAELPKPKKTAKRQKGAEK